MALKAKGELHEAAEALKEALKLAQKPSAAGSAPKEAAEIARELAACRDELSKRPAAAGRAGGAAAAASKGSGGAKIAEVGGEASPSSPPKAAAGGAKAKREVDHHAAKAVAERAAATAAAAEAAALASSRPSLSTFEQRLRSLRKGGKALGVPPEALRDALGMLPSSSAEAMRSFVGEGLNEEILSAIVLATHEGQEPPAAAAARLCHLARVRRFEMQWMFVGKAEKAAAAAVLKAAAGGGEPGAAELTAAAKLYGVSLD